MQFSTYLQTCLVASFWVFLHCGIFLHTVYIFLFHLICTYSIHVLLIAALKTATLHVSMQLDAPWAWAVCVPCIRGDGAAEGGGERWNTLLIPCPHQQPGTQQQIWSLIWSLQWLWLHQTGGNCEVDVRRQTEAGGRAAAAWQQARLEGGGRDRTCWSAHNCCFVSVGVLQTTVSEVKLSRFKGPLLGHFSDLHRGSTQEIN